MPSAPRILDNLPSVYRPEPGYDDDDLLLQLASAVGAELDRLSEASAEVMQSHWFNYADSAIYSRWLGRRLELAGEPAMKLDDPRIDQFPYLFDLPRIAAMVDLAPWREPLSDRERVEAFRQRIRRIVRLHKDGLGTVRALRSMTRAALPQIDPDAAEGLRERNFTVEEFSGVSQRLFPVTQKGVPNDLVGPLMRWQIDSDSLDTVATSVVIEGVTPVPGEIEPTDNPVIEQFDPLTGSGVGVHYQGSIAAGQALAIVPGYRSWLGGNDGIESAEALPSAAEAVNPTAAGPWSADTAPPNGEIVALQRSDDQFVWAASNVGSTGSLWRNDGSGWNEILSGLPEIHCLLPNGGELLIGFETGLSRLEIQPVGAFVLAPDPGAASDPAIRALAVDADGTLWAATERGLAFEEAGILTYTELGARPETETPLRCMWLDNSGDIYCGGDMGLFLYRRSVERWYILQDEAADETINDWLQLDLTNGSLPDPQNIFVPPVNAVIHGPDTDIWLGTDQGIARYRAYEQRRTYTTLLEALPHLTQTAVNNIEQDTRGRIWFATDEGLFVYDQLDWFQKQSNDLVRLPRRDDEQQPTFWRFVRGSGNWQSFTAPGSAGFLNYTAGQTALGEPAVNAILWTEQAVARLGSFDGTTFTVDPGATPAPLATRYKPDASRIVDGGIPALPCLAHGKSDWRYLQREEPTPPTPSSAPAWTREGRLLPPPDSLDAPHEGRFIAGPTGEEPVVFSFCPAARVWFSWQPKASLAVTVRLSRNPQDDEIDPQILDRVWNELQRVKPASVAVYLAVNENIERGQ